MAILIIICIIIIGCGNHAWAITDEYNRKSKTFVIDYDTKKIVDYDFEDIEEYYDLFHNLTAECSYVNDADGVTVEWTIHNCLFCNYIYSGYYGYVSPDEDSYYWNVATGRYPSEYMITPGGYIMPARDAVAIPGTKDNFVTHEGWDRENVNVDILSVDKTDVGNYKLLPHYADQFDGSFEYAGSRSDPDIIPSLEYKIFEDPCYTNRFSILLYLGYYNPASYDITAIKKIRYHIPHAEYIPRWETSVDDMGYTGNDTEGHKTEYFTLQGIKVSSPIPGQLYIAKQGNKRYKIIF